MDVLGFALLSVGFLSGEKRANVHKQIVFIPLRFSLRVFSFSRS